MMPVPSPLVLTPAWQARRLLVVPGLHAGRLSREHGYRTVSSETAGPLVDKFLRRNPAAARAYLARLQLFNLPLSGFDEDTVRALFQRLLRARRLVLLSGHDQAPGSPDDETATRRRLLRDIRSQARARWSHNGRQYMLAADAEIGAFLARGDDEVVRRDDAVAILDRLAEQAPADVAALLRQARDGLTRDWRPPFLPNGFVLLRSRVQTRTPSSPRPAPAKPAVRAGGQRSDDPAIEAPLVDERLDQVTQAQTLVQAARLGVPFCEECARPRHRAVAVEGQATSRTSSAPSATGAAPPRTHDGREIDQASQAATLVEAARSGVAFCEECAARRST
jgi:hypothetical protein